MVEAGRYPKLRPSTGVRQRNPPLFATVFGVLQVGAVALFPPGYRAAISTAFLLTATVCLIGVVVYGRHAANRDTGVVQAHPVPVALHATIRMPAPAAEQTPDPTMHAAVTLARHGYGAAQLADTFGLPRALTEMIVQEETVGNPRSTPHDDRAGG